MAHIIERTPRWHVGCFEVPTASDYDPCPVEDSHQMPVELEEGAVQTLAADELSLDARIERALFHYRMAQEMTVRRESAGRRRSNAIL